MTDAGEVAADIGLEYVVHLPGHDLQAQRLQSMVRVAPRSKAVTAVEEIRFEHSLDNACYRSLQQPSSIGMTEACIAAGTTMIMTETETLSSGVMTVGIPNGRVPVLPGPLGISTRRTAGAR
jgi:hypothetical protein